MICDVRWRKAREFMSHSVHKQERVICYPRIVNRVGLFDPSVFDEKITINSPYQYSSLGTLAILGNSGILGICKYTIPPIYSESGIGKRLRKEEDKCFLRKRNPHSGIITGWALPDGL